MHHTNMLQVNPIHLATFVLGKSSRYIPSAATRFHFKQETVFLNRYQYFINDRCPAYDQLIIRQDDPAIKIKMPAMILTGELLCAPREG